MSTVHNIGISLGNIKTWHDGLGEFSLQLCQQLAALAPAWRQQYSVQFYCHLPRRFHGVFGDQIKYHSTEPLQRVFHWTREPFLVWHSLHQHNKFRAPVKAKHRIQTVHDLNFLYEKTAPQTARRRLGRVQKVLDRSDRIVVSTQYVRQDLQAHLRCHVDPEVVPLGVTDPTSLGQEAIPSLTGKNFYFHISRMAPSKGIFHLIDLAQIWPEQTFVFAGPAGSYVDAVSAAIQERNLRNIHLLPDVSDEQKAWLYNHCSAFLFPSLTEGFGLPPLEAMCFGKPVFMSNKTCLPEIGGRFAHYWDSLDAQSMKNVMTQALREPPEADAVQSHGRSYSWERCAKAYSEKYLSALGVSHV